MQFFALHGFVLFFYFVFWVWIVVCCKWVIFCCLGMMPKLGRFYVILCDVWTMIGVGVNMVVHHILFCLIEISQSMVLTSYYALDIIGKPLISKLALSWFHNVLTFGVKVIEYWTKHFIEKSFKSKQKVIREFGLTLGIVGKSFMSRI